MYINQISLNLGRPLKQNQSALRFHVSASRMGPIESLSAGQTQWFGRVRFDSSRQIFHACVHAGALCNSWRYNSGVSATPQAATISLLAQGPRQLGAIFAACFTLVCCTPKPRVKMASASSNMLYPSTARALALAHSSLALTLGAACKFMAEKASRRKNRCCAEAPPTGEGGDGTQLSRKLYLMYILLGSLSIGNGYFRPAGKIFVPNKSVILKLLYKWNEKNVTQMNFTQFAGQ